MVNGSAQTFYAMAEDDIFLSKKFIIPTALQELFLILSKLLLSCVQASCDKFSPLHFNGNLYSALTDTIK